MDWQTFFPEQTARPLQHQILDFIIENIEKADNFLIEAPPGVGKSAIAVCLASWWNGILTGNVADDTITKSYITTTTISLENQYVSSYGSRGLRQLHSAAHYTCSRTRKDGKNLTCEEGKVISAHTKTNCPLGFCRYKTQKLAFEKAPSGILNAAYLITENVHVGKLGARGLLIADEGHTFHEAICNFLQFKLTAKRANALGLAFPRIPEDDEQEISHLVRWLEQDFLPALKKKDAKLKEHIEALSLLPEDPLLLSYAGEQSRTMKEIAQVVSIIKNAEAEGWVMERFTGKEDYLSVTPISSKQFAQSILKNICQKLVLLSATFIDFDYHIKELGLDPKRTLTFRAPSPFAAANRPVIVMPSVKLDYKYIDKSCAQAAHYLLPILESHKGERGLIFVSSYAQARGIVDAVNALLRFDRLQTHINSGGKAMLLKMHAERNDSVLVSPSVHEGLDMKDDLSRFQIILKLPFPSLGSKLVKRKMKAIAGWYPYSAVLKIIQATGRSVRTETDHAVSYILDLDWDWFFSQNEELFPDYWKESLQTA